MGRLGYGRLVGKETTGTEVNDRPEYLFTFELILPPDDSLGGYRKQWTQWAETHRVQHKTLDPASLEDEQQEPLLYDPERPGNAVMIDGLPSGIRLDNGKIAGGSLLVLITPFLTVTIHGLILLGYLI